MKFSTYSVVALIATLLLLSSVLAAPVTDDSTVNVPLPSASISFVNSMASTTSNPVAAKTLADAMSGTTATASISLTGQNVTAQNSGASHTYAGFAILPFAIASALFLIWAIRGFFFHDIFYTTLDNIAFPFLIAK